MNQPAPQTHDDRAGVIYAVCAYAAWGVLPVYWRIFRDVPPLELTAHRLLWCAPFAAIVTLLRGHMGRTLAAACIPRVTATLLLTSVLISCNWLTYLHAIETDQLIEASLGYYITPLVSFALGFVFFGERMSRIRVAGIALGVIALASQVAVIGHFPWIALTLAFSFGLYGFFRKRAPVEGLDGLLIESALLFPIVLGLVAWWTSTGQGVYRSGNLDLTRHGLLVLSGPITAIPLALFAAGARRIRMSTMGFLQYLAPSITLTLAVFGFGESFSTADTITFVCVWAALAVVALEGRFKASPPAGDAAKLER